MIGETVDQYIARVLPCKPPCDSFGVCENCCDATLIRVGAEIEKRNLNSALEKAEAENLRLFTEMTSAAIEHPCYKLSKELEAENKRLMERIEKLREALTHVMRDLECLHMVRAAKALAADDATKEGGEK